MGVVFLQSHRPKAKMSAVVRRFLRCRGSQYVLLLPSRALTSQGSSKAEAPGKETAGVFRRADRGRFFQQGPELHNPFVEDAFLQACLRRLVPSEVVEDVFSDLTRFGSRLCEEVDALGRQAELDQPYLREFDAWGRRVDELVTSPAWRRMHCISAEEGLVALAYERKHSQWSRLHQAAKLYMYAPSSGLYSCPLAMTDGAARLIEASGDQLLRGRAYPRLTSRDPAHFWSSGQWMTERKGGSDVADGTDTVAVPQPDGSYRLHGYKWFTSATDAHMAFTLARVQDAQHLVTQGTKGLSLFYLETKDEDGKYNNLQIQCLKNKLGTRQLPTAELLLDGTTATMVGEEGRGVAGISPMLTVTRMHNSVSSIGGMRRIIHLARDYSNKRVAFGKLIAHHSLHMQTLARMEVETRGCVLLTLELFRLQGLVECGEASAADKLLLRILTPITKLYTAKQAVAIASEGLECFGGQGYIEDTGLPVFLRDAQVLPIWEGTTNILSLDVVRVLQKAGPEALTALVDAVKSRVRSKKAEQLGLSSQVQLLQRQLDEVVSFAVSSVQQDATLLENAARDFAFSLVHVYIGSLLVEHAAGSSAVPNDCAVVQRWCTRALPLRDAASSYSHTERNIDTALVMDGYGGDSKRVS